MQRIIFLVDMNAFFISCETARSPELKSKPAAVAGDPKNRSGIILAANYEARRFGVKTTMVLHEAKRLCPSLILVPPDRELYSRNSKAVMEILSRYSPIIEQNSIDEAWMDLTGCEVLFGKPVEIASKIMKDIQDELDLWCSIGISENKFLAKMASEMKKPQGITEVWLKDIKEKIWPLPVREMYGIGMQTERKLQNIGIFTIGDLARSNRDLLNSIFGKYGVEIHQLANGLDSSPVSPEHHHDSKSISRSTTLPEDITDLEYARTVLLRLAEEVGAEARSCDIKGKTVSIAIKYADFQSVTRQKSIPATYLTKDIYKAGIELLEQNWNVRRPVRLLGIGVSNFKEDNEVIQLSFEDLLGNTNSKRSDEKEEKLEKAMDSIRNRFGHNKINRAKLM
ncbi:MAG: DNA polymerase IV [Clostridia bacterium]|nr:DNA polymerase IV [Clostridia bacterium]